MSEKSRTAVKGLPAEVVVAPDLTIPVRETSLNGKLGILSSKRWEILIEQDQHPVSKHYILFCKLLYLATWKLEQQGFLEQGQLLKLYGQSDATPVVRRLEGTLFPMLVASGLWDGVSWDDFEEFEAHIKSGESIL